MSSSDEAAMHAGLGKRKLPKIDAPTSAKSLDKEYGKGFKMLQKMGFKTGTGLGPIGREGIAVPIEVAPRGRKNEGLQDQIVNEEEKLEEKEVFDEELFKAHRAVEVFSDRKKNLQYKLWALSQNEEESAEEDIDSLLNDVSVLAELQPDWTILKQYSEALRDKYEFHSAWYSLSVEDVIASAAADLWRNMHASDSINLEEALLVQELRDLVLDDDIFERIMMIDVLPVVPMSIELANQISALKSYPRMYELYIEPMVLKLTTSSLLLPWAPLVPPGACRTKFLSHATPFVTPEWRKFFPELDWRALVHLEALRMQRNLSVTKSPITTLTNTNSIVPPLVLGFLLVESGKLDTLLPTTDSSILKILARLCYHGPGRRAIVDALRGKTVRKMGPPKSLFAPLQNACTLGDVLRERGFTLTPTGRRENGQPVFQIEDSSLIYWKNESLFQKKDSAWTEISITSLSR